MDIHHIKNLIFKELFGLADEHETLELKEWVDSSPQNRELYDRLRSLPFVEKAVTDDNRPMLRRVWQRICARTVTLRRGTGRRRMVKIAAAVMIPLLAASAVLFVGRYGGGGEMAVTDIPPGGPKIVVTLPTGETVALHGDTTMMVDKGATQFISEDNTLTLLADSAEAGDAGFNVVTIPSGGEYTVRLEDGTVVYLNSESELKIPVKFGDSDRTVWFSGEGYFDVSRDAKRPFVVKTGKADVAVLGTEFNLRAYDDEERTVTTLVEGSVEVASGTERVRITPGTQAKVGNDGRFEVAEVDVYRYTAWKSGRIVFQNERTEDIMRELRRWYAFEVHYADESVKDRRFTMDIHKYNDIREVLNLMEKVNKIKYTLNGSEITLAPM